MSRSIWWALFVAFAPAACGGSAKPAETAPEPEPSAAESAPQPAEAKEASPQPEADDSDIGKIPTQCAQKGDVCLPAEGFVQKLCEESHPNIALHMFKKGSPWTRGYLTRKTNAWNASGGASDNSELAFDEEVIILRHRAAAAGGIQVSGASGGYDALRWDGSCVTLASEELTRRLPPKAKAATVTWRWLDDAVQESLRTNEKVDAAYKARRKECKGATMGTVSLKCVKADAKLSEVIVEHVRGGGELAKPSKLK